MGRYVTVAVVFAFAATGCGADSRSSPRSLSSKPTKVAPLAVVTAPTPMLRVPRYDTAGVYPQVAGMSVDLSAVNLALRAAVRADERGYAAYARRQRRPASGEHGVYRTAVDRRYASASTVVVSALMPVTRELFPGQHEGDGWLAMTVRVPSGRRVGVTDLFADPDRGLRALAAAWKAKIRRTPGRPCLRLYPSQYRPTASNYGAFALIPAGIAVGSPEIAACYRLTATVPYGAVTPYLSRLGSMLIEGVRRPR